MKNFWSICTEEGKKRLFEGRDARAVTVVAIMMSVYQLAQSTFLTIVPQMHYTIHLTFIMILCAIMYTPYCTCERAGKIPITQWIYAMVVMLCGVYMVANMENYLTRMPQVDELSTLDVIVGIITVVAVIDLTRRCMGIILPGIGCLFLAYAFWGHKIPGILYHRKLLAIDILDQLVFTTNGIYSSPIAAAATYVFMFVMFGAFFASSGAGDFFYKFSMAIAGRYAGGAGKVAIITSGLFGMINGSPTANVVTTGSFTIPMMKRSGYDGTFSGAVTAVAATGGGIMPPIMGTAAFLMVEMAGISYKDIAIAAFVPGVLYYLALLLIVHFRAKKDGLEGLDVKDLPPVWATLKEGWIFLVPLVILVAMLMKGYTANLSAVIGIIAVIAASWVRKDTRMGLKKILSALEDAAKSAVIVSLSCAVAGCVIAGLMTTGLSGKLASLILSLGGNSSLSALILTAAICTLLGMGMPVAAAYCLTAALCIPSLYELGLQPMEAHMFVVYFATLSAITPPVAVASYAAAGISESNAATVGWQACRIGLVSFAVPFIFVYEPRLMVTPDNFSIESIWIVFSATLGVLILCAGLEGYMRKKIPLIMRGVLIIGGLLLMYPEKISDYIGLGVFALLMAQQYFGFGRRGNKLKKVEKYLFPKNVEECIKMLSECKGEARLVSGATDLSLWIKEGKVSPAVLVDVSDVKEMRFVEVSGDKLVIGAAMTHAEIASNDTVKKYFPALSDGCRNVGSPQIRNVATLAGNIVSAQPAADSVVPMTALDASCEIVDEKGPRIQKIRELPKKVGVSTVDPTKKVLTKIFIDIPKCKYGTSFKRISPREAMSLPVVNVAVMLTADTSGIITEARVVASPVDIVPFRAKKTEEYLVGKKPSEEVFQEASKLAGEEASPRDSLQRGSGAYRKNLVKDLVGQALREASMALV